MVHGDRNGSPPAAHPGPVVVARAGATTAKQIISGGLFRFLSSIARWIFKMDDFASRIERHSVPG